MTDAEKLEELRNVLAKTTARHQGLERLEEATRRMREHQKAFFANRQQRDIDASRKAEREVDRLLAEISSGQKALF